MMMAEFLRGRGTWQAASRETLTLTTDPMEPLRVAFKNVVGAKVGCSADTETASVEIRGTPARNILCSSTCASRHYNGRGA